MAKLNRMPDMATIIASRGRVDYYLWMGIPVARSWPRKSSQPLTARVEASTLRFNWAAKTTSAIDPWVVEAYKAFTKGTGVTWVDAQRAVALGKGWYS